MSETYDGATTALQRELTALREERLELMRERDDALLSVAGFEGTPDMQAELARLQHELTRLRAEMGNLRQANACLLENANNATRDLSAERTAREQASREAGEALARQVLVEDADRRYQRWYWALQAFTVSLMPVSLLLQLANLPGWNVAAFGAWAPCVLFLFWRWRKAARRAQSLRDERIFQLIREIAHENRWLRDEG